MTRWIRYSLLLSCLLTLTLAAGWAEQDSPHRLGEMWDQESSKIATRLAAATSALGTAADRARQIVDLSQQQKRMR